ncbi:MAG TPA: hypothetical protein DD638_10895 [Pasteurellaceae bacterium]|nr:hypothetical protein [Pasteurellaceae bacterium]
MKTILKSIQLLLVLPLLAFSAKADELIKLNTRDGVQQPVLLWEQQNKNPEYLIIFFPSSNGNIETRVKDGQAGADKYYLISNQRELLTSKGFAVAVIDTPSDRIGMGEAFRQSADHATDIKKVIAELKQRFPKSKLVLMGHSRGTVSVGYLSRTFEDQIDATVLLAARYQNDPRPADAPPEAPGGTGLSEIDFSHFKKPVLLVHHLKDACGSTPFADAEQQSKYADLIKIEGNDQDISLGTCATGTNHWFVGQEELVGEKVIEWLASK